MIEMLVGAAVGLGMRTSFSRGIAGSANDAEYIRKPSNDKFNEAAAAAGETFREVRSKPTSFLQ